MIKMVTVKSSVDGFKFPPAISENTLDLTSDEIKVLSRACKGFGLFFNKVAKVSEADDTDQFWEDMENLHEAIKEEGLEESREFVTLGDYCVILYVWKFDKDKLNPKGRLKAFYDEVDSIVYEEKVVN